MKNRFFIFLLMGGVILFFIIGCSEPSESFTYKSSGESSDVKGVKLNKTAATIHAGNTEQLTATVLPSKAKNKNVTWVSDNHPVAIVSSTGLVTAGSSTGTAIITATTVEGGFIANCEVTVSYTAVTHTIEFKNPGNFVWTAPGNITGNVTVTLVGGGGGGGSGCIKGPGEEKDHCGGGGGAGQVINPNFSLATYNSIQINVGNGGGSGGSGGSSSISVGMVTYTALGGDGGQNATPTDCGQGGAGYPAGGNGKHDDGAKGGDGGDNGRGHGVGRHTDPGDDAPAASGGGGGGGGHEYPVAYDGGNGGSGYIRIDYTVLE